MQGQEVKPRVIIMKTICALLMLPEIPGSRSKVENPSGSAAGWNGEGAGGCGAGGEQLSQLPRAGGAGHSGGGRVGALQAAETTAGFNVPEKNRFSLESICSLSSEIGSQVQGLLLGSRPQMWWDS